MLIDTIHFFAELVPMSLGLPYVHIWNVLHFDFSGLTPFCATGAPYETTLAAIERNTELAQKFVQACEPTRQVARRWAMQQGLHVDLDDPDATLSKLAVITQTPKVFDFPGVPTSAVFHYAGPLGRSEGRKDVSFAWERLDDRPLIYASMGTLVNGSEGVFRSILDAVSKLPQVQLVLSIGSNIDPAKLEPLPANAMVVPTAPQVDLLKRAALCITHAGLNTVLEAISLGVPLVAVPVSFDQPGTASRVAYHGLGEILLLEEFTSETVLAAVRRVLETPSYREHARYFQEAIARNPGPAAAADILERVLNGSAKPEA
ncbi:MAG: glycosyl transferase [Rhodospirillales bacterium]|nr:glycosyl transferase [Acetobacter sp.]